MHDHRNAISRSRLRSGCMMAAAVILLLSTAAVLTAQTQMPKGTVVERLDNGLQVLMIENPILPMTGINVVVKTGSAYESYHTSGMSHMLEHLLFNGTTGRTQQELYRDVDRIGGYNNANTSYYYTNFMMVTPNEHIGEGMQIQADMLFNSILPQEKFEKEKGIVLEEIARSLSRPQEQVDRDIDAILFRGHSLSLPVLGTYTTIQNMERDEVYEYYKKTYVPNNMIISVIGNFNPDSMRNRIRRLYGSQPPSEISRDFPDEWAFGMQALPAGARQATDWHLRSWDGEEHLVHLYLELPDHFGPVHTELLTGELNARQAEMKDRIRELFPEVKSMDLGIYDKSVQKFLFISLTLEGDTDVEALGDSTLRLIRRQRLNIDEERVAWYATRARTDFLKNLEKPHMFGIYNAGVFAVSGIDAVLDSYQRRSYTQAVSELRQFHWPSVYQGIHHAPVSTAGKQENREGSVTELLRDDISGLTMLYRRNPSSELIAIHFLFRHKRMYELKYGDNAAKVLHDCFGQMLNEPENQRISNRFGLTYKVNDNPYIPMDDIYLHPDFSYIRIEGLADDVAGIMEFISERWSGFSPTKSQYRKAVEKFSDGRPGMMQSTGDNRFTQLYRSVIYEQPPDTAEKPDLTYELLKQFTGEYFIPQNTIISAVSPVETPELFELMTMGLNGAQDLPGEGKEPFRRTLILHNEPVFIEDTLGGEQSYLFWGFSTAIDPEDKPALRALDLLLNDTIVFNIREEQGRAYRMSAGVEYNENRALFHVRLGTRPENIEPLLQQIPGFFEPRILSGMDEQKLEIELNKYLGRMMFRRLSSINQAYYMAESYYFHNDPAYDQSFMNRLEKVGFGDVVRVAEKYMKARNPVTVIVR